MVLLLASCVCAWVRQAGRASSRLGLSCAVNLVPLLVTWIGLLLASVSMASQIVEMNVVFVMVGSAWMELMSSLLIYFACCSALRSGRAQCCGNRSNDADIQYAHVSVT